MPRRLRPECSIKRPVLNRLGKMFGFNSRDAFLVSDRPGYLQDPVMGPGAEALLSHGSFQQAFALGGQLTVSSNLPRGHVGIAIDFVPPEAFQLDIPGTHHPGPNAFGAL